MSRSLRVLPAVRSAVRAMGLGPADAGLVRLAEVLAETVDGMGAEVRERMLGQTAAQLSRVLVELGRRAPARGSVSPSPLDELRRRRAERLARVVDC
jgi:hypothetical protein